MHFVHRPYIKGETIAAIATPPGEGGVAIIRISGDEAITVAAKVYAGPLHSYVSHQMHVGKIVNASGQVIDKAVIVVMKAPRSYTGENTVEIHCHGGSLITRRVLQAVLDAGARAALPGEFTFKAYMNGKLDLAQAEAVQALIAAKNDLALQSANQQLQGALSKKIEKFQRQLVEIAAILEAWVDFPEEGLEFASLEEITASLSQIAKEMDQLSQTFEEGKMIHEGLTLCLSGAPNVGKSSLMNALLRKDRAIVTDIPGTTRDRLEADLKLGGLHFRLIDTAGIRQTEEVIEQEGIRLAHEARKEADLILLILDASRGIEEQDHKLLEETLPSKTVIVWNKVDLPSKHAPPKGAIPISAKEKSGIDLLTKVIEDKVWQNSTISKEEVVISQERHQQALKEAVESTLRIIEGLNADISPEFLSLDMRGALKSLATILGQDDPEKVLHTLFSTFCVGK